MDRKPISEHSFRVDAIQVHSAPEALAEQIIGQIRNGKLPPGACLPSQRELARAFQVGLGTVREAVKILHVMGYLNVVPGRGTFVAEDGLTQSRAPSTFDRVMEAVSLSELMKAREIIESGAAQMAAEQADAENIERLKEVVAAMSTEPESIENYYNNDFAFHLAVAEAANNPAILEIVKRLVDQSHAHTGFMNRALGISMPVNIEKCVQTAKTVVYHIKRGDGPKAAQAMRKHLNVVNYELRKEFVTGSSDRRPNPGDANAERK